LQLKYWQYVKSYRQILHQLATILSPAGTSALLYHPYVRSFHQLVYRRFIVSCGDVIQQLSRTRLKRPPSRISLFIIIINIIIISYHGRIQDFNLVGVN